MTLLLALLHAGFLCVILANLHYLRRRRKRLPEHPALSVLIPARNEEANLARLLPSLCAQRYPAFEVIVYDDASEDRTWEVVQSFADLRLKPLRGEGPPPGWVGKVHALYQATRAATGDLYLFLDADAHLEDDEALQRLAERYAALPEHSVLTGLTRLRGRGLLLVSLVQNVILAGLPWPLVRRSRSRSLGALNGQCWMIRALDYHRYEPHRQLPAEVLEDVQIGRYLKERGIVSMLVDVQREVAIYMYPSYREAWRGFRKNAYLIMGGRPLLFVPLFAFFGLVFVLAPLFSPWLLLSLYAIKRLTDHLGGFPLWVSLLAPLSYLLGSVLQLDSALSHWTGRASWKGRRV